MSQSRPGAQVVARVSELLRVLGRHPAGAGAPQLAVEAGLARPTAHRLLTALATEGLVRYVSVDGTWQLGPEIAVLGSIATQSYPLDDAVRPSLRRLADATGESSFFSLRRGGETACLLREEGSFPVRSFILHVGARFPLGVGSAGIAILALLPESERMLFLRDELERVARFGPTHANDGILARIDRVRMVGYAVNPGLIHEGAWGMGAAVFDTQDRPVAALSLTGIEPRFRAERQEIMGKLLLEEAQELRGKIL